MKILRITDIGYETGGVENGIVLAQSLLEKRGHTVRTFAGDSRPDLPHFNHYSYHTDPRREQLFYAFNPLSYSSLKKALSDFRPDVVHVHSIGKSSASILFPLGRYPTVLTVHGPEVYSRNLLLWCFPRSSFRTGSREFSDLTPVGRLRYLYHRLVVDPVYRMGFRNVDRVVTLSSYMHRLMQSEGIENVYVPNGTSLFRYRPLPRTLAGRHSLAFVGRLEAFKGIDYVLQALPAVISRYPHTRLYLAGDGSYKSRLTGLVRDLGLSDRVEFLGHLDRDGLSRLYHRVSVVVVPSVYPEAFGKVGVEAMSAGRPVIAADVGGITDWLDDGKNGLLVPPGDAVSISKAVAGLFSSPARLARMSRSARETAEKFSIRTHVDNMERIYLRVIKTVAARSEIHSQKSGKPVS